MRATPSHPQRVFMQQRRGITMRLDFGKGLTHCDIAKWARTSPEMVMRYYDQAHLGSTLDRIGSFTATATRA